MIEAGFLLSYTYQATSPGLHAAARLGSGSPQNVLISLLPVLSLISFSLVSHRFLVSYDSLEPHFKSSYCILNDTLIFLDQSREQFKKNADHF